MKTLEAPAYNLRKLASLFSRQSEALRQILTNMQKSVSELTDGRDGWQGLGSQAFRNQVERICGYIGRGVEACQKAATTLYQLDDRILAIHGMKKKLADIQNQQRLEVYRMRGHEVPNPHQHTKNSLDREEAYWKQQIEEYSRRYDADAKFQFQQIIMMAPAIGALQKEIEHITTTFQNSSGAGVFLPVIVTPTPGGLTGRAKVDYLNETMRMNKLVVDYYSLYKQAKGPNGQSADEMRLGALKAINEARKAGGTIGTPIVLMHGLQGGEGTFQTLVQKYGGYTKIYTFKENGEVWVEEGPNRDADQPLVQFVFEDGAMHFDRQSDAFAQMSKQMKSELKTETFMVASHSMGGVITTKYILDTGGDDIQRFVTLGSPILGSDADASAHLTAKLGELGGLPVFSLFSKGMDELDRRMPAVDELQKGSDANNDIFARREQFNQDIEVFSAGGNALGPLGDSVVMPNSAFGLRFFANPSKFYSKMYEDSNHTQLHENEEELEDTMNFLRYGENANDK